MPGVAVEREARVERDSTAFCFQKMSDKNVCPVWPGIFLLVQDLKKTLIVSMDDISQEKARLVQVPVADEWFRALLDAEQRLDHLRKVWVNRVW